MLDADDLYAVDDLLDAAHAAGWRPEWRRLAPPSTGYRAALVRPDQPAIVAFGSSLGEACRSVVKRLAAPPGTVPTPLASVGIDTRRRAE